eukprot:TRINITY_DN805_c0_g2_i1.p1 TRINITY_DN805_c0_g2~~TRINITY_DN805_c0_g2_i1.p1  ORF type:complete len:248 (+),score=46.26 TRINITY_DN805_c0_g2_i1:921-1664(+)
MFESETINYRSRLEKNKEIKSDGCEEIYKALKNWDSLKIYSGLPLSEIRTNSNETKTKGQRDELNLHNQGLDDPTAIILSRLLEENKSITSLDLRNNPDIFKEGGVEIYKMLKKSNQLNTFGGMELHVIDGMSDKMYVKLEHLELGDCEAVVVSEYLRDNTIIKQLYIGRGNPNIGKAGASAIALVVKESKRIEVLNSIYMSDLNGENKSKETLGLHKKNFTDFEAIVIAEYLKDNEVITWLKWPLV